MIYGDWVVFSKRYGGTPVFTCGRRPAGLLATLVVVVVVVVVVGGGGNNFYTWAPGEPMYGFVKLKARSNIL